MAAIGASRAVTISTSGFGLSRPSRLPPPNIAPLRHVGEHHDGRRHRGRDGADEDVAVPDVRQLVRDHAFEFGLRQQSQDAFGRGHGRVLRIAPGRERVGRHVGNDVDLGHRQARPLGQTRVVMIERCLAPTAVALYIRSTILSENQ